MYILSSVLVTNLLTNKSEAVEFTDFDLTLQLLQRVVCHGGIPGPHSGV